MTWWDEEPRCFRCGQTGHLKSACPSARPAPAPAPADAGPVHLPPPVPIRRAPEEIADYGKWAATVRASMGWAAGDRESRLLAKAREQVRESRRDQFRILTPASSAAAGPSDAPAATPPADADGPPAAR